MGPQSVNAKHIIDNNSSGRWGLDLSRVPLPALLMCLKFDIQQPFLIQFCAPHTALPMTLLSSSWGPHCIALTNVSAHLTHSWPAEPHAVPVKGPPQPIGLESWLSKKFHLRKFGKLPPVLGWVKNTWNDVQCRRARRFAEIVSRIFLPSSFFVTEDLLVPKARSLVWIESAWSIGKVNHPYSIWKPHAGGQTPNSQDWCKNQAGNVWAPPLTLTTSFHWKGWSPYKCP